MDAEETHEDAPKDGITAIQHREAWKMAEAYCSMIKHSRSCGFPIESEDIEHIAFKSFESAMNEAGYTEERGHTHPATVWQQILDRNGV